MCYSYLRIIESLRKAAKSESGTHEGERLMEIRVLNYFLTVAREGSFSNAAKVLHVTQPTLSRQLSALEDELGRPLFTRGKAGVMLTEQGVMLRRYAESIVDLAEKAEEELALPAKSVQGSVHIAAGETKAMSILAQAMALTLEEYPGIQFKLYSGTTSDLMDGLVKGQYDLLLECELQAHVNMNVLRLPVRDRWGVITRADNPLAQLDAIGPRDLEGVPLITSRQGMKAAGLREWAGASLEKYRTVAEYSLGLNSRYLIEQGIASAIAYEGLIEDVALPSIFDQPSDKQIPSIASVSPTALGIESGMPLVFRPLDPAIESHHGVVWRKTLPTKQTQVFLDKLSIVCEKIESCAIK